MKNNVLSLSLFILLPVFIINLSSCFTIGGAIMGSSANKKQQVVLDEKGVYEGWHKPTYKNTEIRLTLIDETQILGLFQKEEIIKINDITKSFVFIELQGKLTRLESDNILVTEIIIPEKHKKGKRTSTYVLIGLALDIVVGAAILYFHVKATIF